MSLKPIPEDYEPEGGFKTFDDGEYNVTGFEWFSIDQKTKKPILVSQAGQMVGRLNFTLESGEEGPPFSVSLNDMSLIPLGFGVKKPKLPPLPSLTEPDKISAYMEAIEKVVNEAEKTAKVKVSGGWVSYIHGATVPEMFGYFQLTDLAPKNGDGLPESKKGEFGYYFFATFQVVGGEGMSKTPWDGATFMELVPYALHVEEVDGIPTPMWNAGEKSGNFTLDAKRLSNLMNYTSPTLFEGEPLFSNPYNLLPDWLEDVQKNGAQVIKGSRVKNKKGRINLDLLSIQPGQTEDGPPLFEEKTEEPEEEINITPVQAITETLSTVAEGPAFVKGTLRLTTAGRKVAGKYLTPLKKSGKLENQNFDTLTFDEIKVILDYILEDTELEEETVSTLDQVKQEVLVALGEDALPF